MPSIFLLLQFFSPLNHILVLQPFLNIQDPIRLLLVMELEDHLLHLLQVPFLLQVKLVPFLIKFIIQVIVIVLVIVLVIILITTIMLVHQIFNQDVIITW